MHPRSWPCAQPKEVPFRKLRSKNTAILYLVIVSKPDLDEVKAVSNFPTPKNVHDIRSFLVFCSYFQRLIKGFCYLAEPSQLLNGDEKFRWGPKEVETFNNLKKALTSDPELGIYNEKFPTEIHTDASGYGIGAIPI
ncbi:hypothetical protein AVEN_229212-1 [Araneus ventricosus]|uniref:RNA-directed DNA polymerase n=1 Tax=Araneus ventricosus TaxID=182803 RepID=A0A4Y2S7G5_ARAVE|nr:hypothetical protein AVEN_229212-1 [Araneus ventricosus]